MSFHISEKTYVVGIWFVPHGKNLPMAARVDFMGIVMRDSDDEPWRFECRTRHHHSDDPFDEQDIKKWYVAKARDGETEAGAEAMANEMAKGMAAVLNGGEFDFVPVHGGVEKFMAELKKQPWAHIEERTVQ